MNGWFIALIIIYVLSLGVILAQHGKPRDGNHSFWGSLIVTLVVIGLAYMSTLTGF